MNDTPTIHLTFSGPTTIVHGTLPITISSKQSVGGTDQPLNITLWVPLGLLSEDLKQQASDSVPLDGLISLKGWHAMSNAGDTHFPDTVCIELDNVPDADEPWGRIDKDSALVVSLAVQPEKDNYEINHQVSTNYRGEHLFWRDAISQAKFDVSVSPKGHAAVGQAAPQLNIEFGTSVQDPTALEPGTPVTLHWKVPNGLHGILKGPQLPSDGQRLTGSRLITGTEQIHVNTTQTYTLEVTVKGDAAHDIQAARTLTVSALLPENYGNLAVSPLEVLPYGETRATFSASMVSSAVLEIHEHGELQARKARNSILSAAPGPGRTDDNRSFASEEGGLAIPINTANTTIKLLANVKHTNLLLGSEKVEVLRWEKAISTLPTTLPPRALCFAGTDERGVLALCAADGIWLADVGADENRDVSKPEFVKATSLGDGDWLDLTAFEDGFAALCRRSSGAVELVRFDLTGTAASTSTPLTVPNDVYAVCAHADGVVRFWDLANLSAGLAGGKNLQVAGHDRLEANPDDLFDPVTAVAVSGNGLRVVTADYNKTVKVWHTATGQLEHTLSGHTNGITALAITADGSRAISGADDVLKLWDLSSGQELDKHWCVFDGGVTHVAFTPDGSHAVFSTPSMLKLINGWDLDQGMSYKYTNHDGAITAIAVTPDGTRFITASANATLTVWDLATDMRKQQMRGHTGPVNAVAVTPDGSHAVSASDDGTLKVWHLESGSVASTIQCHEQHVLHVAITPDGQRIITYGVFEKFGGRLALWDLKTGQEMAGRNVSSDFAINGIAITPYDSPRLYSVAGRLLVTFAQGRAYWHDPHKEGSAFVPDRTMALLPPHDLVAAKESLYSLRRDTGEVQVIAVKQPPTKTMTFTGSRQIQAVAVTPDGSRAVTLLPDGDFEVWNLKDGGLILNSTGHYDLGLIGIAITPDGQHIVAAGRDSPHVWDVKDGKECCTVSTNTGRHMVDFALAPDGNSVVTCDYDGTIDIWTLATGKLTKTRTIREPRAVRLCVTSDSGRIVSAGHTLQVWDLKTGELKQEFGRQGNSRPERIENLALMPDDKTVITHGSTETRVWDMATGALKRTMQYSAGRVFSMAGTSDGRLVLAGSVWGEGADLNSPDKFFYSVNVWNLATGELERTLSHYQTPEGRDRHMPKLRAVAVTAAGVLVGNGDDLEVWPLKTTLAPAVDEQGRSVLANGVAIVLDDLFVVLGDGSYTAVRASDPSNVKVPQDWWYDPHHEQPAWYRCGHGLDLARDGLVAYRSGSSISLWAVGGKPVGSDDDGRGVVRLNLGLNGLHVFDPNERSSSVAHHSS